MKNKNPLGFQEPNYTQLPNDIFIMLPQFGEAELKFILAICRLTFGFHQEEAEASLTTLQKMTGLSRPAVVAAAKKLEEIRGLIIKKKNRGVNVWVVNIVNQSLVNNLNLSSKRSKPVSLKKEVKINVNVEEKELPEPQIELPFPANPDLDAKLDKAKIHFKEIMPLNGYNEMIEPLIVKSLNGKILTLVCLNIHHQNWIEERIISMKGYLTIFRSYFDNYDLKIKLVLMGEL